MSADTANPGCDHECVQSRAPFHKALHPPEMGEYDGRGGDGPVFMPVLQAGLPFDAFDNLFGDHEDSLGGKSGDSSLLIWKDLATPVRVR